MSKTPTASQQQKAAATGLDIPTLNPAAPADATPLPDAAGQDTQDKPAAQTVTIEQAQKMAADAADAAIARMMERLEQAKNRPVQIRTGRDAYSTAPDTFLDIPVTGSLDGLERTDQDIEVPTAGDDAGRMKAKADMLAFLEEKVLIQLHESTNANDQQVVPLYVNGAAVYITRGVPTVVRRKYVEMLCRAKAQDVKVNVVRDANGDVVNRTTKSSALAYPFSVIEDRNPRGAAWLAQRMREG
jgi:tartrate dehydratase beta subunit/fumarate hydratase class I family protein